MNHCGGRPCPCWEVGNVVPEGGAVDLVNQDPEEGDGLVTRVGFELRIDLNDEGGSYSGEQTGLISKLVPVHPYPT